MCLVLRLRSVGSFSSVQSWCMWVNPQTFTLSTKQNPQTHRPDRAHGEEELDEALVRDGGLRALELGQIGLGVVQGVARARENLHPGGLRQPADVAVPPVCWWFDEWW